MDRSRSKGDYLRTLERRISDLQAQVDVLVNRDQSINWIEIGSTGAPAFQNGHYNWGGDHETCAFRKDSAGNVHLKGLIGIATPDQIIFILPEGFRPSQRGLWNQHSGGGACRVDVYANGQVNPLGSVATYLSLAGIIFRPA